MITRQISGGHETVRDISPLSMALAWAVYLATMPLAILALAIWLWPKSLAGGFLAMLAAVASFLALVVHFDLPLPH